MIEAFDIDLLSKAVAPLVAGSQLPVQLRRHRVIAVKIDVAADAQMLGADKLCDVIEVIEHVFDRSRLVSLHKHTHAGYSHNASGCAHLLDSLVSLAARMPGNQRATVRVSDQHGLFGNLKSIERRAVATVRDVDGHPHRVHSLDDRYAEIADTFVAPFGRTVADHVSRVVSQLGNALADSVKEGDVGRSAKLLGVLQSQQNPDLTRRLDALEIACAVDSHEMIGVIGDESVPRREELQHFEISVRPAHADANVKDVYA